MSDESKVVTRADLTVVMITTSRRPSYFAQTVTKLFLSDGAKQNAPVFDINNLGAQFHSFKDTDHNPAANMARALSFAARQTREWVLFLEDDLLFCDRFIDSVAAWLSFYNDDTGLRWRDNVTTTPIHLFGSSAITVDRSNAVSGHYRSLADDGDYIGFANIPLANFYGTQAFAIRRHDAASLAAYLIDTAQSHDPGKYDLTMVEWCRSRYPSVTHFVTSIPSFVQHIGEESSIRPGEKSFNFPSFPGEWWSYVNTATYLWYKAEVKTKGDVIELDDADIKGIGAHKVRRVDGAGSMAAVSTSVVKAQGAVITVTTPPSPSIDLPLEFTTSRRVKLSDFHSEWLRTIAAEMDEPLKVHRKIWEYCAIAKIYLERVDPTFSDTGRLMYQRNILEDLKRDLHSPVRRPRVLGFGVGHDPLPAWFAMRGAEVVATDKPESDTIETWKLTGQHASGKDQLRRLKSVTDEEWARIDYEPCDMNAIDTHYVIDAHWESGGLIYDQPGFDLTFSCGSFEHIGGIQSSLDFFVRQMACLRPGGIAVHTTEYSINHTLHDSENLCLLRSRDIAILSSRLAEQGDLLLPFDPTPGMSQADCYIDRPPYAGNISTPCESALPEGLRLGDVGPWHLNLALDSGHVTTSIVLIAIRGGMATRQLTLEDKRQTKLERYVDNSTRGVAYRRYKNAGKPSVLFLGDAVVSSGFAKSTHGVCDHLYINGCNVRVIGMNYYGAEPPPGQETLRLCNYPIHPAFEPLHGPASADGATLLPRLIYDYSPDIVVIQNDSWNIPSYLSAIDQYFLGRGKSIPLIVGFIAVDGENQPAEPLNRLAAVITWTEYGMDQLRCGGYYGPGYVAPLAVDTSVFHPLDRDSIRASFVSSLASMSGTLAPDIDPSTAFIVGFIGRNQPRKRLDLLLQSYSLWVHGSRVTNTLLFLHVGPTGDSGFDLPSLVRYYDLLGRVIINTPEIGQGESESDLVARYNLFDVFLSCTQGEGFWFPGFEAAACGIPIIAPDHSAITEFFSSCSLLIPPSFSLASAPHNGAMRTLGGLVDPKAVAAALDTLYLSKDERARLAENGLDMVKKFTWKNTGKKFEAALRRILGVG